MFEAFFGGGGGSRGPVGRVRPGSDSLLRMQLTLNECATGVTKQVTVDTTVLATCVRVRAPTATPRRSPATPAVAAAKSKRATFAPGPDHDRPSLPHVRRGR